MKKIVIFILLLFPCSLFAQEKYEGDVKQEYEIIAQEITHLRNAVTKAKEKLANLKSIWYNTCVEYLKAGEEHFKAEELDKLLGGTIREIDGEELYEELARAKECFVLGKPYTYPSMKTSEQDEGNKQKKKEKVKKQESPKKQKEKQNRKESKKDKDSKSPVEEQKKPATPVEIPEVKNEKPPVEPVAPQKSDPVTPTVKTPRTADKGEMEEGMSKKSKNNDGTNK